MTFLLLMAGNDEFLKRKLRKTGFANVVGIATEQVSENDAGRESTINSPLLMVSWRNRLIGFQGKQN